jgi:kynurenine 3-monooxygenase
LLGTDGAFSAVRLALQFTNRFDYSQSYLAHGYKELSIYPGKDAKWQLDENALHIWPRKDFMMIALPNIDGSFTCTLFLAYNGEVSFEKLNTKKEVEIFFETYFKDLIPLIPNYTEQFFENPTSNLVTIKCSPWNYESKVLLLGDSAHAIVPFYGQGMNAGFEDSYLLDNMIDELDGDWERIIPNFAKMRKPDGDAIADLAMRNFIEMRDLTANPDFLFRKKVEKYLLENHSDYWMPLYSMVTFSNKSYSEALREGQNQDKIMEKVMENAKKNGITDVSKIANMVLEEVKI